MVAGDQRLVDLIAVPHVTAEIRLLCLRDRIQKRMRCLRVIDEVEQDGPRGAHALVKLCGLSLPIVGHLPSPRERSADHQAFRARIGANVPGEGLHGQHLIEERIIEPHRGRKTAQERIHPLHQRADRNHPFVIEFRVASGTALAEETRRRRRASSPRQRSLIAAPQPSDHGR